MPRASISGLTAASPSIETLTAWSKLSEDMHASQLQELFHWMLPFAAEYHTLDERHGLAPVGKRPRRKSPVSPLVRTSLTAPIGLRSSTMRAFDYFRSRKGRCHRVPVQAEVLRPCWAKNRSTGSAPAQNGIASQ
jgi:hypothetical protein